MLEQKKKLDELMMNNKLLSVKAIKKSIYPKSTLN